MRAAGAATTTAQPTPRQTSPDKNDHFPPTPAAFYVTTLSVMTGFTF